MPTSTIPTLKDHLYDALVADASIVAGNIQVSYGFPVNPGRELVWLHNVAGEQTWAALGKLRRNETYELTVHIRVERQGADQQAATERCFVIAGYLENLLRADPTVNGAVTWAGFGGPVSLEEFPSSESREAILTIGVQVQARI